MNTFAHAIDNQLTTTENGMKARKSSANACVDLFYKIGASRGKNIVPNFVAAQAENKELALRIALWARDVRGGAGERKIFRDILQYLESTNYPELYRIIAKVPELGRWDDLLVFTTSYAQEIADTYILGALSKNNQLCAKWMPRQGVHAERLRKRIGVTPKQWRKWLVSLTNVVEQKMCAKQWNQINFNQVPSLAHARYKRAFGRNAPQEYGAYASRLKTGNAKINAAAVYPYDVLKGVHMLRYSHVETSVLEAQWNALPNYMGSADVLPLVDVSGSMQVSVGGIAVTALDIAVSLGLYCADKNKGAFNGCFLTFSERPELLNLRGSILQKVQQLVSSNWGMNTNIAKAFKKILETAVEGKVEQSAMPKILLILSDMQFDQCIQGYSAFELLRAKYSAHGYTMPKVVFWNLAARDNAPVKFDQQGTSLVSGFSPSVLKAILSGENFTPEGIMLKAVMDSRYDF